MGEMLGPEFPSAESKEIKAINLDEVLTKYQERILINNTEEIAEAFQSNLKAPRVCLEIPLKGNSEEETRKEMETIDRELYHAICGYADLINGGEIGKDIKGILREIIGDLDKHTRPNDCLRSLFVLVTKDGLELSFHIANPSTPGKHLPSHDEEYKIQERNYDLPSYGGLIVKGLENDLIEKFHCPKVIDESYELKVGDDALVVGKERDLEIVFP